MRPSRRVSTWLLPQWELASKKKKMPRSSLLYVVCGLHQQILGDSGDGKEKKGSLEHLEDFRGSIQGSCPGLRAPVSVRPSVTRTPFHCYRGLSVQNSPSVPAQMSPNHT